MTRWFLPAGLRAQLALAIALVTAAGVIASFVALYSGTTARLRGQIDTQLRTQAAEWRQFTLGADISIRRARAGCAALHRQPAVPRRVVDQRNSGQRGPDGQQHPEILAREEGRGEGPVGLLDSPAGISTASVAEAGDMRVLAQPIVSHRRYVGTLRVANPLTPVSQAQSSLRRTFVVVGTLAVVLAAIVGIALATLISAPLRRITAVAAAATAGDLSRRAGPAPARGEVGVLANAFDQMLERLERTFKRQRDFVSDASHELRTPLSVLRAQVELLDRETDEHIRHAGTVTLLRRLDELDRLVGDMLTLASADAGELVQLRPIDLGAFFKDVRRDLPLFGERDFRLNAVGGTLEADPDRLTQVLRNLVRNAVAHTSQGDRVEMTATALGGRLKITVSDTGPGIPAEELEQIFERFHRLDRSRSRDSGGTGLGLAIARTIVEAHGGQIRAESSPGHGATFRIELPGYRPRVQHSYDRTTSDAISS